MVLEVWAVVSTATHSKFSHFGDSRVPHEPLLDVWHIVFGGDDCRMPVYRGHACAFVPFNPTFEGVCSPCGRIGKHIVQYLDGVAERNYQRIISCRHILSSFALIHSSRNRLHSSNVGFTQENKPPDALSR